MSKQLLEIAGVLMLAACVVASGVWIVGVEHPEHEQTGHAGVNDGVALDDVSARVGNDPP